MSLAVKPYGDGKNARRKIGKTRLRWERLGEVLLKPPDSLYRFASNPDKSRLFRTLIRCHQISFIVLLYTV